MFKLVEVYKGFYIYRYNNIYITEIKELSLSDDSIPYIGIENYFNDLERWKAYGVRAFTTLREAERHIIDFTENNC